MKSIYKANRTLLIICLVSGLISCGKSSSGGGTTPTPPATEENIVFSIDIDPGSGIYAALGGNQDAKVTISSKMPSSGVTVDVTVKKDSDNSIVSSALLTTTVSPITVTLSNLTPGVVCTASFIITSKTTSTNTAAKSFKIARK
ncbi:MAG: hypothetical protein JWQ09_2692 [Segetibacter sp.]|nr:hypothetical protein [Segetibacter sp.]